MDKSGPKIYSLEELCYYLCENLQMLDITWFNEEFLTWLAESCRLEELSLELSHLLKKKESLNSLVTTILRYAHYCEEAELTEITKQLTESAHMNQYEKRKSKIARSISRGNYLIALRESQQLLSEIGDTDMLLEGQILHNIGTLYADLYYFEQAADYFKEAYRKAGNDESYQAYLLAKKMLLTEEEYVDFLAGETHETAVLLELEQKTLEVTAMWKESEEKAKLDSIQAWKSGKRAADYYDAVETCISELEDNYRENVMNI
ncbi:MAG: hypothetical protein RRX92_10060 [Lachnospiraceae bacterium]